jgi:hypothetical protein
LTYTQYGPFVNGSFTPSPLSAQFANGLETWIGTADIDITRLKARLAEVSFNPKDYGAVGNGTVDDTAAIRATYTAALAATDPINVEKPVYDGLTPTVYVPLGTYVIDTITIAGTVNTFGVGGGIYAASVFLQRSAGQSMLILAADTDGSSNASVFENMTFKSASGTSDPTVAQVKTAPAIGSNSVYFRNCWFKTPETNAVWMTQGDDIQFIDCTFDVVPFTAIKLGDNPNTRSVSNVVVSGCTFFNIGVNAIEASLVNGLTIGNNKAYNADGYTNSVFLLVTSGQLISSANNTISNFAYVTKVFNGQVMRFSDVSYNTATCPYYFGGGGIIYGVTIVGTTIHGKNAWAHGAFYAEGTGLQVSTISKNSIMPGGTTSLMFDMSDSRVTGNVFNENSSFRFSGNNNFANAAANGA